MVQNKPVSSLVTTEVETQKWILNCFCSLKLPQSPVTSLHLSWPDHMHLLLSTAHGTYSWVFFIPHFLCVDENYPYFIQSMGCMTAPRKIISPKGSKVLQAPSCSSHWLHQECRGLPSYVPSACKGVNLNHVLGVSGTKKILHLYYHLLCF